MKKAKELENKRQKELKQTRESTVAAVADLLVLTNLRNRGVKFDATVSDGVGVLAGAMDALMTDGDALKKAERDTFTKLWASYMNQSGAKVPGLETTYQQLHEGVTGLLEGGALPAKIPAAGEASAPKEPEKKKKEPKPLPADYIKHAKDERVVADEDKEEEVAAVVDDGFLGGFDAFDSDGDDQPAAKEEVKEETKAEAPKQEGEAAEGDGKEKKEKKKWEDSGNGGDRGRGRGRGNNRGRGGRGGRGRGGNPNVDDEGFEKVVSPD